MAILLEVPALATFAIACILIALAYAYRYTLGALLLELAKVLNSVKIPTYFFGSYRPFGFLAVALVGLNNAVLYSIGKGIEANQWAFHKLMHYQSYAWQEVTEALAALAEGTERAFDYLAHHKIKALIAVATGGLSLAIPALWKQVHALEMSIAHAVEHPGRIVIRTINRTKVIEHTITKFVTQTIPGVVASAGAIALPGFGRVEREADAAWKWVRAQGKYLTAAGVAALVIGALGKLGLGWTRCSKVGKVGRAVCGMDESLLESLLAGALVVASSISIVELARECRGFTADVDAAVKFFVRELH